jgi:hypothetical protein
MKNHIYNALYTKYKAQEAEALATLEIYFNNPAGIGEHPGIIEEMDKLIEKLATAEGNLDTLNSNYKQYSK